MANIIAKVETITPEIAKVYLEHNEGNRNTNKSTVAYYAGMMISGEWQVNGEAIVFDKTGRLVNGGHRLSACVYANVPFETMVIRGVESESFYTFDSGRTRKAGDSFQIANIQNATNISAIVGKYISMRTNQTQNTLQTSTHSTYKSNEYKSNKISNGMLIDEYNKDGEYWQQRLSFASSCYARCRLTSKSFIGGIVAYLNKEKGYAVEFIEDFFSQLFFEERTELDCIRLLRRKLIDDTMKGGKIRMSALYKEQLMIICWEMYKQGRDTKVLRWTPNTDPTRRFE